MRLIATTASPYARKVRAALIELRLEARVAVELAPIRLPQQAKPDVDALNPLGKIPLLILDDGALIADSRVIVAYLDALAGGGRLLPGGAGRWAVETRAALADGIMDAGFVVRMEQLKDAARRDPAEIAAYQGKIARTLNWFEGAAGALEAPFDAGQLGLACALDWVAFRGLLDDALAGRPRLAAWLERVRARPCLAATAPAA